MADTVHRAHILRLAGSPAFGDADAALREYPDGGLRVDASGAVREVGPFHEITTRGARVIDHGGRTLLPGLIDTHVHFPQIDVMGAPADGLSDWLERHVFPAEARLRDVGVALSTAARFVDRLLRNGTTTAMVFGVSFLGATDALFAEAERRGVRCVSGRVAMDIGPPAAEPLLVEPDEAVRMDEELIARRHRPDGGMTQVALQPRYAPSCSPALLRALARLYRKHAARGVYVTTHWAEDASERGDVTAARGVHGGSYLEAYRGLLGERTVLAHGVWPEEAEIACLASAGCSVAHCPASNLFLGSGLMPLRRFVAAGMNVSLGSDVGAGDRLSLFDTANQAYKVQRLQGYALSPAQLLYLVTVAGGRALRMEGRVGTLDPGKEADFVVLDPGRREALTDRLAGCSDASERLFALLMLAGEGCVAETYVRGRRVHPSPT